MRDFDSWLKRLEREFLSAADNSEGKIPLSDFHTLADAALLGDAELRENPAFARKVEAAWRRSGRLLSARYKARLQALEAEAEAEAEQALTPEKLEALIAERRELARREGLHLREELPDEVRRRLTAPEGVTDLF